MRITAAVLLESGTPFSIEELELDEPRSNEIIVEIAGTGVCHTDQSFKEGSWPFPIPSVLGHEGAGVVVRLGSNVTDLVLGDHVIMSSASCGSCRACLSALPNECTLTATLNMAGSRPDGSATLHSTDGHVVYGNFTAQSSFASHALTEARFVTRVDDNLPLHLLGTLGCGIQTGAGAVLNVLRPRPGSSVVIFGMGAVGLAAVAAARFAGCTTIVAVDVNPSRLPVAREFGASDVVDARTDDISDVLNDMSGGGFDSAIEASGAPAALPVALAGTHATGTTVLVGVAPLGTKYEVDSMAMVLGRTLTGSIMGGSNPRVFIPRLLQMYRAGLLPLESVIRTYPLSDIESAFSDARSGSVIKPVVMP